MRIRILRQPPERAQELSLKRYRAGQVYDVPATLAAYLVTEGFAMIEMRSDGDFSRATRPDRRRNDQSVRN